MISTNKNWSELAEEAASAFTTGTRDNGEEFYHLNGQEAEWVRKLVYAAHKIDDVLPNDYIYEYVHEALCLISENGGGAERPCEIEEDINEIEGETYNSRLLAWVSSNLSFSSYVDEAIKEFGCKEHFNALQVGNMLHKQAIARNVLDSIDAQAEEVE